MNAMPSKVGPMIKVKLLMRAFANGGNPDAASPETFSFIFGIGSQGVTPFEKALFEKTTGDSVRVRVEQGAQQTLFGHLTCSVFEAVKLAPPLELDITITHLEKAEDRELVKAMAGLSGCGSGCDCDCGCGC